MSHDTTVKLGYLILRSSTRQRKSRHGSGRHSGYTLGTTCGRSGLFKKLLVCLSFASMCSVFMRLLGLFLQFDPSGSDFLKDQRAMN